MALEAAAASVSTLAALEGGVWVVKEIRVGDIMVIVGTASGRKEREERAITTLTWFFVVLPLGSGDRIDLWYEDEDMGRINMGSGGNTTCVKFSAQYVTSSLRTCR